MTTEIRLANIEEAPKIQEFIKKHWKEDHIFVESNSFFEYEMCTEKTPNFILALNSGNIIGLVGFTQNRDTLNKSDLFLVMFRVLKVENSASIGIKILQFAQTLTTCGVHTVGANDRVLTYYKFLGFKTGYLNHYYWLNSDPSLSNIFRANANQITATSEISQNTISTINISQIPTSDVARAIENLTITNPHIFLKSKNFFLKRFASHPIYKYQFYKANNCNGILVVREVLINEEYRAWRIVDFYGDQENFTTLCKEIITIAENQGISFIDLYVSGVEKNTILNSGLLEVSDEVIIPNYLEPLVMKNVNISFVTSYSNEPFFFRGDCDQDRPSRWVQ